ncbi:hypothetical protein CLOP_g16325 [Closterium sp. NIES-67]|nr:hypothetical protein CLOP_g16325 [Closterium sp. NIES-67]
MKYGFSDEEVVAARSALLEWYDANRRDLPWRAPAGSEVGGEGDEAVGGGRGEAEEGAEGEEGQEAAEGERRAYGVWVSEVMLQQTRVSTVAPYFHRWMARWPSLPRLAAASLEGAQHIQQRHGGRMPRTAEELLGVPGIGPYTAAAIASIAFNQAAAAVDGNVMRILARLRALPLPLHQAASSSLFALLASRLLHPSRPGDFNQALMDLGSLVCSPSSPSCSSCPLSPHCRALALQQQGADRGDGEDGGVDGRGVRVTDFPVRKAKAAPREEWVAVCVVERREWRLQRHHRTHRWHQLVCLPRTAGVQSAAEAAINLAWRSLLSSFWCSGHRRGCWPGCGSSPLSCCRPAQAGLQSRNDDRPCCACSTRCCPM